jgi:hypothetical protein
VGDAQKTRLLFFVLSISLEHLRRKLGMPLPSDFAPTGFGVFGTLSPSLPSPPIGGVRGYSDNSLAELIGASALPTQDHNQYITESEREDCSSKLDLIKLSLREIGVTSLDPEIDRVKNELLSVKREKVRWQIDSITHRVVDELEGQLFLHVNADRSQFYNQSELFGQEIARKLAKINGDITDAGTCYAFGLYTACVFHLMRVMEHCVQGFGKKLNVTAVDISKENWHQIMIHVHKNIEALPGGAKATARQNKKKRDFAMAASRLDYVRIAWRNDVMHPKATYDEREALEVLNSVKAFLGSIVKLV